MIKSGHTVTKSDIMNLEMCNHDLRQTLVPFVLATWILLMIPGAQGLVDQSTPINKTIVPAPLPPEKSGKR